MELQAMAQAILMRCPEALRQVQTVGYLAGPYRKMAAQ
jgi:hypothetical protein